MTSFGIKDLVRAEAGARRALEQAEQWDERVQLATTPRDRRAAEERALAARRRAVRERLRLMLGPGAATDALAVRLDAWMRDHHIGTVELDALADALTWKETPHGRP